MEGTHSCLAFSHNQRPRTPIGEARKETETCVKYC
jgi:hypothetical protein